MKKIVYWIGALLMFVFILGMNDRIIPVASGAVKYKEAPQLAKLVKAKKLPPVQKRLPEEPFVVTAKEIGKYGGVYKGAAFGPRSGQLDTEGMRLVGLLTIEPDLKTFKPNLLKSYQISDDSKTFTLNLRKGLKWSNGDPLTADDFLFWYEDILLNKDMQPSVVSPNNFKAGDQFMKMTKVNNYAIKISFVKPNPAFEIVMARSHAETTRNFFAPQKYLSKWHLKYNPKANEIAKKEGFNNWTLCLLRHLDNSQAAMDTKAPDVTPWVLTRIDDQGNKYFDRNPYYHVVDRAGKQLPYIDQQVAVIVKDAQVRTLKLISGELHAAGENPLPVKEYTLFKENELKGNYKVYLFKNTRGSDCAYTFNINDKDPVLRKIFTDVRFRHAMSYAINRNQINDVLYFGKAEVRQASPPENTSFYEDWMGKYAIEYNPDKANALLDEMGLKWDPNKKVRLLPNGKPFSFVLETIEEFVPMSEMVVEFWNKVGVNAVLKPQERTFYLTRGKNGDRDAQAFTLDGVAEFNLRSTAFGKLRPGNAFDDLEFQARHKEWLESDGASGEEPPAEIKRLYEQCLQFPSLRPGSAEYEKLGKSITTTLVKNLWFIGLSVAPRVIIISNKLGNTPALGTFAYDYSFWKPYRGDTWYFK
jgi:peptide/nickel transport system substrate-binding protein